MRAAVAATIGAAKDQVHHLAFEPVSELKSSVGA